MSQQINLLNPALRKQRDRFSSGNVGLALGLVLVLMLALTVYAGWRAEQLSAQAQALDAQLKAQQAKLAELSRQAADLKPDAKIAAELAQAEQQLAARKEVIAVLQDGGMGKTEGYSESMRALARQSVNGLWLTGFSIAGGGNDIAITGRALDADLLPTYIRRLNAEKVFQGRSFAALEMKRVVEEPLKTPVTEPVSKAAQAAPPVYIEFRLSSAEPTEQKP